MRCYFDKYETQTETAFGVPWLDHGGISGLAGVLGTKAGAIARHGTPGGIVCLSFFPGKAGWYAPAESAG